MSNFSPRDNFYRTFLEKFKFATPGGKVNVNGNYGYVYGYNYYELDPETQFYSKDNINVLLVIHQDFQYANIADINGEYIRTYVHHNQLTHSDTTKFDFGDGNDEVVVYSSNVIGKMGAGDDKIVTIDNFSGITVEVDLGEGNDIAEIRGNSRDTIFGGNGNDRIATKGNADIVFGEDGDDYIDGGDGHDKLNGGAGDDLIFGGAGNDIIDGGDGDDTIAGGDSGDNIIGGNGDDLISGQGGSDYIYGKQGNDILYGETGNDVIDGGAGDDKIIAGEGANTLTGGEGHDEFIYYAQSSGRIQDVITDFEISVDKIVFADAAVTDFNQLRIEDTQNGTLVSLGDDFSIKLHGITEAELIANLDAFYFAF